MSTREGIHRTTVDIDLDAFDKAREILGTRGYRETIDEALREVVRIAALRRAADMIRRGEVDLVTPEELAEMRAPRVDFSR